MPDYTLPQAKSVEGLHPTAIEWTDYSANPLRAVTREGKAGWGCQKVATGCMHCYAEAVNIRFGTGLPFSAAGMKDVRVVLDEARVAAALTAKPRGPFRAPDGRPKVFVCDMTDLFGEWVPFDVIDQLFALFALRPKIDWQILTKRPERMAEYLNADGVQHRIAKAADVMAVGREVQSLEEEWRWVDGYPGYQVSNHGNVRGPRGRVEPQPGDQGHCRVALYRGGKQERVLVHRLVVSTFLRQLADGEQVRHRNGDPTCNALPNLVPGSQADNWADSKRHGSHRRYSKLSAHDVRAIRERAASGESAYRIAKDYPVSDTQVRNILRGDQWSTGAGIEWPLKNVWAGCSAATQADLNRNVPHLLRCPAAVRFISFEPLVEDLGDIGCHLRLLGHEAQAWVIVGGESGPKARPCPVEVIRDVVQQCGEAGTACFVKQIGSVPVLEPSDMDSWPGYPEYAHGTMPDGRIRLRLRDSKGGDPSEWSEDLRVRQWPERKGDDRG